MMNKYLTTLLLSFSCFVLKGQTFYPGNISGCIARWDFANGGNPITSLPDVSGNSNNASVVNSLKSAPGFRNAPNKAMAFDSAIGYASVPDAPILHATTMTMLAVVKMNGFYSGPCQCSQILLKGFPYLNSGVYGLGYSDNVYDHGDCNAFSPVHMQEIAQFGPATSSPAAGNYITTGQWYLVAASYDGSNIKYYQVLMDVNSYEDNVMSVYTFNSSAPIGANMQDLTIGRTYNPPFPYWFNGTMEEVVLFNRALTDHEMQLVYDYLWGIVAITSVSSHDFCAEASFTVDFSVNNTSFFQPGNIFSVQLSDATGSFASAVTIGSINSTGGGAISCTIPAGTPTGNGYRVRIVASDVPYTTKDNGVNISVSSANFYFTLGNDTAICPEETITLSPKGNYSNNATFSWNTGSTASALTVGTPGIYWLKITDGGCSKTDTILVDMGRIPFVSLGPDTIVCMGETLKLPWLISANAGYSMLWQDGSQYKNIYCY